MKKVCYKNQFTETNQLIIDLVSLIIKSDSFDVNLFGDLPMFDIDHMDLQLFSKVIRIENKAGVVLAFREEDTKEWIKFDLPMFDWNYTSIYY